MTHSRPGRFLLYTHIVLLFTLCMLIQRLMQQPVQTGQTDEGIPANNVSRSTLLPGLCAGLHYHRY